MLCASGWLGWHGIPHEKQQPLSRPRHGEERQKSFGFVEGTQCVVEESKPKDISKVQFVDSIFHLAVVWIVLSSQLGICSRCGFLACARKPRPPNPLRVEKTIESTLARRMLSPRPTWRPPQWALHPKNPTIILVQTTPSLVKLNSTACCWLLTAGRWLLGAGCWLLAPGCWPVAAGSSHLAAGNSLLAAECWQGFNSVTFRQTGQILHKLPFATSILYGFADKT